jgi:hypothetical protein
MVCGMRKIHEFEGKFRSLRRRGCKHGTCEKVDSALWNHYCELEQGVKSIATAKQQAKTARGVLHIIENMK